VSRPIPVRRLYTADDVYVEHQPGARPGFEWFAEIRLGIGHAGPVSACCTASTRDEAVRGVLEMVGSKAPASDQGDR